METSKYFEDIYGDLVFSSVIGEGSYGSVKKVKYNSDDTFYAIKKMKGTDPAVVIREVSVLKSLQRHPSFVKLHNISADYKASRGDSDEAVCRILMDYYPTTLGHPKKHDAVRLKGGKFKAVAHQLVSGLAYLEKLGIMHRDIKNVNILYDPAKNKAVYADFGMATQIKRPEYSPEVCTCYTRAPEIFKGDGKYDIKSDVWSLGATLFSVYFGEYYYFGYTETECVMDIARMYGEWEYFKLKSKASVKRCFREILAHKFPTDLFESQDDPYVDNIIELLGRMLEFDVSKRAYASELLELPLFEGMVHRKCVPKLKRRRVVAFDNVPSSQLGTQKELSLKMYQILVEWMGQVMLKSKSIGKKSAYLNAVDYVNRYLAIKQVQRKNFQLLGCVCMYIALKVITIYPPDADYYVDISDRAFTFNEFTSMLGDVLETLDYDVLLGYDNYEYKGREDMKECMRLVFESPVRKQYEESCMEE